MLGAHQRSLPGCVERVSAQVQHEPRYSLDSRTCEDQHLCVFLCDVRSFLKSGQTQANKKLGQKLGLVFWTSCKLVLFLSFEKCGRGEVFHFSRRPISSLYTCLSQKSVHHLQLVQNAAARCRKCEHISPVWASCFLFLLGRTLKSFWSLLRPDMGTHLLWAFIPIWARTQTEIL